MRTSACILSLVAVVTLVGCHTPPVYFFDANPYVSPYQETFDEPLTIVLGKDIENSFTVGDMEVHQFRKSLQITLHYMFDESFTEVRFAEQVSPVGYTLHLYRLRPSWQILSSSTNVVGTGDVVVATADTKTSANLRYDGAIYQQGEKKAFLDALVTSQKYTFQRKGKPEVFRDGVRELCEVLYKELLKTELQSDRTLR